MEMDASVRNEDEPSEDTGEASRHLCPSCASANTRRSHRGWLWSGRSGVWTVDTGITVDCEEFPPATAETAIDLVATRARRYPRCE